ncbi:DUF2785 domain-containing protein [Saccharospirillum salsuginis]|uniref:Membrane protein n=1 Tax=Saccharospirillum salsuginis TaxID=418750 RepID=A0A918KI53_9GAMM|nr:DUF2785 domain-containing protein [Saccharospirillum salsuginis]GGX63923.1 membrane protein [Saccharospirillum salsuginis]
MINNISDSAIFMDIYNLKNPDSNEREALLDEICSSIENATVSEEDIENSLLPKGVEICLRGIGDLESDTVFGRSFGLIVIACILDKDNRSCFLDAFSIAEIVEFVLNYMHQERDFRGYVNNEKGWAHSVAHLGDLLHELLMSCKVDDKVKVELLSAFSKFLTQPEMPVFLYDEDQRVARAIFGPLNGKRLSISVVEQFLAELIGDKQFWLNDYFKRSESTSRKNNVGNILRSLLVFDCCAEDGVLQSIVLSCLKEIDLGFL